MNDFKNFTYNFLAISDKEVAQDWVMGLARATAKAIVNNSSLGLSIDEPRQRWGQPIEGGMNEHLEGAKNPIVDEHGITTGYNRDKPCKIIEVYELSESSGKRWEESSINGPSSYPVTQISAKVTCHCGRLIRVPASATVEAGEFIYSVVNEESL